MPEPGDFPAPDVMDSGGRLRRLFIALLAAAVAATIAYYAADSLAKPDELAATGQSTQSVVGASKFVFYMAGLAFIVTFLVTTTILKKRADKKYEESLSPKARVVR